MNEYLRRDRRDWVNLSLAFYGQKVFFSSDFHLNHSNIIKYSARLEFMSPVERDEYHRLKEIGDRRMRSLRISHESLDRMNDAIIDGVNSVVGKNDILWNLGDVYFGRSLPELVAFRKRINCKHIYLVLGNHDKFIRKLHAPFAGHSTRTPKNILDLQEIIQKLCESKYNAQDALYVMQQIPTQHPLAEVFEGIYDQVLFQVDGQNIFAGHFAHVVWEQSHRNCWCLYGHSHASLEPWREKYMPDAKTLDVGIDYRRQLGLGTTPWGFDELQKRMENYNGQVVDHHAGD